MMLKVLVYGYSQKVWSSRQLAKAVRENIHFMWLAGGNTPDFRTLNRFRAEMKEIIDYVFGRVKWCWGFRRFLLRGIEKVKVEWGLLSIAHNISRLALIQWA